tara:strand:+ start:3308 stop:4165 length:858 start_codon:yes stop_codon:yes gene_type:complete
MVFLSCTPDYGIKYDIVEEIRPTTVVIDSFFQQSPPEHIDVLIILDTSGSMNDNYENVSNGVEILRADIEKLTSDYRIGYINTSLQETYFNGPYDQYSTVLDMLMAPYTLGSDRVEEAFAAMYEFITQTPEGTSFFREEADKLFIFVSDEDEQSAIPTNVFYDWLMTEFSEVQQDAVTIVLTEDSTCDSAYSAMLGTKYIELSTLFYKDAVDLCSDWSLWLADSTFLIGIIDELPLTKLPIIESLVVYLNGAEIQEWSYDAAANMVILNFEATAGDLIEVGYVVI